MRRALPGSAEHVVSRGIVATLVADGVTPVKPLRQQLLARFDGAMAREGELEDLYQEALVEYRLALAVARSQEISWLSDHLALPVADAIGLSWERLTPSETRLWVCAICWDGRGLA
jgi:hypothetical protein